MPDKPEIPRLEAMAVASEMIGRLKQACARIAIVGSLRRGKETVGDIELLYVPLLTERENDMFSRRIVSVADEVCEKLLRDGVLKKRPNVKGHVAWGESNKLAIHVESGIPLDLFSTTEQNWWVSLVIRTGSKETNLRLTRSAIERGRTLNAYGRGVTVRATGQVIEATSEREVFELCGVPWLEPYER